MSGGNTFPKSTHLKTLVARTREFTRKYARHQLHTHTCSHRSPELFKQLWTEAPLITPGVYVGFAIEKREGGWEMEALRLLINHLCPEHLIVLRAVCRTSTHGILTSQLNCAPSLACSYVPSQTCSSAVWAPKSFTTQPPVCRVLSWLPSKKPNYQASVMRPSQHLRCTPCQACPKELSSCLMAPGKPFWMWGGTGPRHRHWCSSSSRCSSSR